MISNTIGILYIFIKNNIDMIFNSEKPTLCEHVLRTMCTNMYQKLYSAVLIQVVPHITCIGNNHVVQGTLPTG